MSEFENIAKALFTYGPSAFAVFVLIFAERRAYAVWSSAEPNDPKKTMLSWLYLANWLVIFGLIGMSLYVWTKTNISDEKVIQGVLGHVHQIARVSADDTKGNLFLAAQPNRRSYRWRLISSRMLPDGTEVHIVNDRSRDNHEEYTIHLLRVRQSFYNEDVTLMYDESNNKLILRHQGKQEELEISDQAPSTKTIVSSQMRQGPRGGLVGLAYATTPFSPDEVSLRLESNDLAVRRQAREELAEHGLEAMPWIRQVLSTTDSYRQLLGVLVALNKMPDAVLKRSYVGLIDPVLDATFSKDDTLKQQASQLTNRLRGLAGSGLKFHVIATSSRNKEAAQKEAAKINQISSDLKVTALPAQNGLYGLYVGTDLSFQEAVNLREKAISNGLNKTYIRASITEDLPD